MLICISDVLNASELKRLRELIGLSEFVDGALTVGARAKRVKNNEQLAIDAKYRDEIQARVGTAVAKSGEFALAARPKRIRPFIISRYVPGMTYGKHVDNAIMGKGADMARTDVAMTLFLSDPTDYEGGELTVHGAFGEQEVKLPAGWAVVYPASSLHEVKPVTRGTRLAAVTWIESLVRDPAKRELLYELSKVRKKMVDALPDTEEADLAGKCYSNLLRMWADI